MKNNTTEILSTVAVQNFVKFAYHSSQELDLMKAILTNDQARDAFAGFSKTLCHEDGDFMKSSCSDLSMYCEYETSLNDTFSEFPQDSSIFSQLLSGSVDVSASDINTLVDSVKGTPELVMALNDLPAFIESTFFKEWQTSQIRNSILAASTSSSEVDITIPEILVSGDDATIVSAEASLLLYESEATFSPSESDAILAVAVEVVGSNSKFNSCDVAQQIMKKVDYLEINRILRCDSWLFAFLAAVENLPISITLSTARKDRRGFPLIYANKYFETVTGYTCAEVTGANCRFLRRNPRGYMNTEEADTVEVLSNALRLGLPASVALTNFKRDGTPFRNLLTVKPLFDVYGEYQYIIGMQLDITNRKAESFVFMNKIFSLLDVLPCIV
uniref:Putative LOV domain-containing protein n=1 Tax=Synura petersenii TaxID=52555 RepID=A0A126WWR9_9STRA|nr:putative LOV domain-containing protein [Synura petersenii]